jgi:hypothetical protein
MTYDKFSEILKTLEKNMKDTLDLYKLNIDLINFTDPYDKVISILIEEIYGKEGADWFLWFCYENDFGKKKLEAFDENKNAICRTPKEIWKFLEKNYKK